MTVPWKFYYLTTKYRHISHKFFNGVLCKKWNNS